MKKAIDCDNRVLSALLLPPEPIPLRREFLRRIFNQQRAGFLKHGSGRNSLFVLEICRSLRHSGCLPHLFLARAETAHLGRAGRNLLVASVGEHIAAASSEYVPRVIAFCGLRRIQPAVELSIEPLK